MRHVPGLVLVVLAFTVTMMAANPVAHSPLGLPSPYTAQILKPPPSLAGFGTQALAMNNLGAVFGVVLVPSGRVPVLWTKGLPQTLPVPPGYHWTGTAQNFINDNGTVVSTVAPDDPSSPGDQERVIVWRSGAAEFIPELISVCEGGDFARPQLPYGLNRAGHVLFGPYCNVNDPKLQRFIWDGGSGFSPLLLPVLDPEDGLNMWPTSPPSGKGFQISSGGGVNALGNQDEYAAWTSTSPSPGLIIPQVAGLIFGATFKPIAQGIPNGPNDSGEVVVDDTTNYPNACPGRTLWDGTSAVFLGQSVEAILNDADEVLIADPGCTGTTRSQLYIHGSLSVIDFTFDNIDPRQFSIGPPFLFNAKRQVVVGVSSANGISALLLSPVPSAPPLISVPGPIVAEATSPQGAQVGYATSAVASDGSMVPTSCAPPSASVFPLGSTTVTCTATDVAGNQAQASFAVTVQDTTPPSLSLPASIRTPATSPSGAIVAFNAGASDKVDPNPTLACSPGSGALFPIGSSVVTCTSSDRSGNITTGAFTVTVVGAAGQLSDLVAMVQSFNIQQGISNSLDTKLSDALAALQQANAGDLGDACGSMTAFANEVQAQSGQKLTISGATQLTAIANRIAAVIGCR